MANYNVQDEVDGWIAETRTTALAENDAEVAALEKRIDELEAGGPPAPVVPNISVADASINEGDTGTGQMVFTVSLSVATTVAIKIDYITADVLANSGTDYSAIQGSLVFAPGETSKTVSVPITGDRDVETNETFKLTITLASGSIGVITDGEAIGTIVNTDVPPVEPPPDVGYERTVVKDVAMTDKVLPGPAASITDADGAVWTLRQSDRAALKNGAESGLANVLELWLLDGRMFADLGHQWMKYFANGWSETKRPDMPNQAGLRGPIGPLPLMGSQGGVAVVAPASIQAAVDANPFNTAFVLSGTFKRQSVVPKSGDRFVGLTGAVMDGEGNVDHAFYGGGHHVNVENLTIKNYTAPVQKGAINIDGSEWLVKNCDIGFTTRGAGVNVMNDAAVILSCRLHDNGQQAWSVHGDIAGRPIKRVLFDNCEYDHNNPTAGTWAGSEQGGGKALRTEHLEHRYFYTHDNHGSGIWYDYDNIWGRVWAGMFGWNWNRCEFEISYDFWVRACDFGKAGGPHNTNHDMAVADILCGNAGGLVKGGGEICYNKFAPGGPEAQFRRVFGGREQPGRSLNDAYGPPGEIRRNRNTDFHHNTVDFTKCTLHEGNLFGLDVSTDGTSFDHPDHNTFDYNHYLFRADQMEPGKGPFVWKGREGLVFDEWKAYGHDAHSTFEVPDAPPEPVTFPKLSTTAKSTTVTLSNNDLTAASTLRGSGRGDKPIKGKKFFVMKIVSMPAVHNAAAGYANVNQTYGDGAWLGQQANGVGFYANGEVWWNGIKVATMPSFVQGDLIWWAFDGNKYWRAVGNGPWNGDAAADPSAGTGSNPQNEGTLYPAFDIGGNGQGGSVELVPNPTPRAGLTGFTAYGA